MAVEIALFRGSRTRYREDEAEDRSTTVSGWFNGTGVVRLVSCTAQRHACVTWLHVKWARARKGGLY